MSRAMSLLPLAFACARVPPKPAPAPPASSATATTSAAPATPPAARTMTVLVSSQSPSVYCNGEQMDSAGYRKTLTREKSLELPPEGASETDIVRAVVDAATQGMCQTVMRQLEYRNDAGTLHIPRIDGWAGVSIAMCSCRPEVEVNFARIPGVERVVWDGE
jgi:hypothetical protein